MANNKSAEKRIKTNERNRLTNVFIKLQFEL
jgi:ribosomal protein S20